MPISTTTLLHPKNVRACVSQKTYVQYHRESSASRSCNHNIRPRPSLILSLICLQRILVHPTTFARSRLVFPTLWKKAAEKPRPNHCFYQDVAVPLQQKKTTLQSVVIRAAKEGFKEKKSEIRKLIGQRAIVNASEKKVFLCQIHSRAQLIIQKTA